MTHMFKSPTITAAELVIRRLQQHGIQQAFGVVGGAIMYITDAMRRSEGIRSIFTHHEQGAAIAAEAYCKLTNNPAIVFATAGPGATNIITGVADAYMDSIPMVVLLGDVRSTIAADFSRQRYNAPQEVNQAALMQPIVKQYISLTPDMDARGIVAAIDAIVQVATSGRPGPVVIAIPLDVQGKACDAAALEDSIEPASQRSLAPAGSLRQAMQALLNAKRPLVLLGAGVRIAGMLPQVDRLLTQYRLPWCVSIGAVDLQDEANPLSCGCVGPTSQRSANTLLQAADCVLALATSFDQSVTGFNIADLVKNKTIFVINVDPGEKLRFNDASIRPIDASIVDFFEAIDGQSFDAASHDTWREEVRQVKAALTNEVESALRTTVSAGFLSAYDITEEISRQLPAAATVVLGISLDAHTVFNAFKVTRGQRVIVSRNLGPMGWDVPAALGAAFAANESRMLILITGDGSLMVNVQELAVIAALKIPVCVFVFSNDGYASIRTTQSNFFGMHFFGCNEASGLHVPPLEAMARGFGLDYAKLNALEDIGTLLTDHAKAGVPRLVECCIDPSQLREPRLVSKVVEGVFRTPTLHDMTPPLKPDLAQAVARLVSVNME